MKFPNLVHSISLDKTIYTHDLKTDKKVLLRTTKNGFLKGISQRSDNGDLGN